MKEVILLKFGEISLKGQNRSMFEQLLLKDVRQRLKSCGKFTITSIQSTVSIEPIDENFNIEEAYKRVKNIFGIIAVSRAAQVPKDLQLIMEMSKEYLKEELSTAHTFKVQAKRSDKKFPYNSPEIMRDVGGYLLDNFNNLTVDVRTPELTVIIEIRDFNAYIHKSAEAGAGGMPCGSNGKAALLVSGGIDSPVAGYMVAKRGVSLEAIHFFSHPYTSERAKLKVLDLLRILSGYSGTIKTHIVPFTEIQEEIKAACDEEYFTLVMRRFMMKISEIIAVKNDCSALITGESIGQVASQTILALGVTDNAVDMPVFRPVIGMDKEEIITIARKIGTFETSILPFEDCCTIFTPKHPRTRPKLEEVIEQERKLKIDELIEKALNSTETFNIYK